MIRNTRIFLSIAAALVLMTCTNGVNLLTELTDDVMLAKNLYLSIESSTPATGAIKVNPDAKITVTFDRAVDMASVTPESLVITPTTGETGGVDTPLDISYSFNESTLTLTVDHAAYFKGGMEYTVRVTTAVAGADAAALREEYSFSFTAGQAPVGSIVLKPNVVGKEDANSVAINNVNIPMAFTWSTVVDGYEMNLTGVFSNSFNPLPIPTTITVPAGDGVKTVYIHFRDSVSDTISPVYSDSIILDTVAPTVSAEQPKYLNATGTSPNPTMVTAASDDRSGIKTIAWTHNDGSGTATFSDSAALNPVVYNSSASDSSLFRVRVTVTDWAGNSSYSLVQINVDRTPPNLAPVVTGPASPTVDRTPTYSWSPGGDPTAINVFRYRLDSGSWSSDTTGTSYTPSVSDRATHALQVQQRDTAGNWSSSGSYSCYVTPCIPLDGETGVGYSNLLVQWRPVSHLLGYEFFIGLEPDKSTMESTSTGTTPSITLPSLGYITTYYWFVRAYVAKGEYVETPIYSFTTMWHFIIFP